MYALSHCLQPPLCNEVARRKRDATGRALDDKEVATLDGGTPATIEVYSGLYVNEASDVASKSPDDVFRERVRRLTLVQF